MTVQRSTPVTSGTLVIAAEPGALLMQTKGNDSLNLSIDVVVSGAQGAIFLGKLIEEATALRAELEARL